MNTFLFASDLLASRPTELLTDVEIATTGHWIKNGRKFSITRADLVDIVANFQRRENGEIVCDFEHASENPAVSLGQPIPAAGWVHGLTIKNGDDGESSLWADITFTEQAKKLIAAQQYRYVSPALDFSAADKRTGKSKGTALTSIGLTNHPFLESLEPIQLSETLWLGEQKQIVVPIVPGVKSKLKVDATKQEASENFSRLSLEQKRARVSRAIAESHREIFGTFPWIEELAEDHAVVRGNGKRFKVPYEVADDGTVRIKKPVPRFAMEQASDQITQQEELVSEQLKEGDHAVERNIGQEEEEAYHRDGLRPDRGGRAEAESRAKKIDEPADDDETEELTDEEEHTQSPADSPNRMKVHYAGAGRSEGTLRDGDATLPRLRVRRMKSAGHHAVVDGSGKLMGFIHHDDLTDAAREGEKPASREVLKRTDELLKKKPTMRYAEAHAAVLMSDTALADRYRAEHLHL